MPDPILDLPMPPNGADAKTVRDYLINLLAALWYKREGFSGKRPFGNGGWELDLYAALVLGGVIKGELEEESGHVIDCEEVCGDQAITEAIQRLGKV